MLSLSQTLTLALKHHQSGELQQAERLYRQVLEAQPDHADALHLLGLLAHETGNAELALENIGRAIQLLPTGGLFHYSLGLVLGSLGRLAEAEAAYRQAILLSPEHAEACNNLAIVYQKQGNRSAAVPWFEEAIRLRPDYAVAHYNLANALREEGRLAEAVKHYQQALLLKPDLVEAHDALGIALQQQGRVAEAIVQHRQAIRLRPTFADPHNGLGLAFLTQGRVIEALVQFREAIRLNPASHVAQSNLLFCLSHDPATTPADLLAEHRRWASQLGISPATSHDNGRSPDRRLRIGYVSPDFRHHAVALSIEPVLAEHNHQQFEIFCYSDVARPDRVTYRLQQYADKWHTIAGWSDEQATDRIRQDRIDILIDLAGHSGGNRLLVFARKPAPVQVTYLGYPQTTGLPAIDYRLTDAIMDPLGESSPGVEEPVRLPRGWYCFAPPADAPCVSPLPALRSGRITFGSLARLSKINAAVIELWSRVLLAIPGARFLLFPHMLPEKAQEDLERSFAGWGIGRERLCLRTEQAEGSHLKAYDEIDISLDTFPWASGTTSLECLWMGVPLITLRGNRAAGRLGASVLTHVGLPELIAETAEQFVALAVNLAGDLGRLESLRASLRDRMRQTICDGRAFTRDLEKAYRAMWHKWCGADSREQ